MTTYFTPKEVAKGHDIPYSTLRCWIARGQWLGKAFKLKNGRRVATIKDLEKCSLPPVKSELKTERLIVKITPSQKQSLRTLAGDQNISDYVLSKIL